MSGLILSHTGAALAQGFGTLGATMMREADRLEELKLRLEARKEEKDREWELKKEIVEARRASAGSGGDPEKATRAEWLKRELSTGKTDRAGFEKDEPLAVPNDDEGNPMPATGKKVFDKEGYDKAEKARVDRDIGLINKVTAPGHYDDLTKGERTDYFNSLIKQANEETDPVKRDALVKQIGTEVLAAEGKDRFKVQGNTEVDVATGETKETEVGKAKAKQSEAAARKSDADAELKGRTSDPNAKKSPAAQADRASTKVYDDITKLPDYQLNADINQLRKEGSEQSKRILKTLLAEKERRVGGGKPAGSVDYSSFLKK